MKDLKKENARKREDEKKNPQGQGRNPQGKEGRESQGHAAQGQQQKAPQEFKIKGNWDQQSKELKKKYSELRDEDLKFQPGEEKELIKKMEKRLNKDREEVINILKKTQSK